MNKVFLMGRLTREPETRYSASDPEMAITRYTLAVPRRGKKEEADFINVIAFGKAGEFAAKYFNKGQQVIVVGRMQSGSYEKDGIKHYTTDVIAEEQEFAEKKKEGQEPKSLETQQTKTNWVPVEEDMDDDIPF